MRISRVTFVYSVSRFRPLVLCAVKVTVNNGMRGVYLRQPSDVSKKTQWAVTVKPVLHEDEHNDKRVS